MRNAQTIPHGRRILSQTGEHALRASLYLARRHGDGLIPAREIAAALGTPTNYTGKTLQMLAREGLVRSERGPRGGYALAVDPGELSLTALADAVERSTPPAGTGRCLLSDRPCDGSDPCPAHALWVEVQERTNELLSRIALADLLAGDSPHKWSDR